MAGYRHRVSDVWKMLAVTFIRAKETPATIIEIILNHDPPLRKVINDVYYQ